jgi:hypothetical protein
VSRSAATTRQPRRRLRADDPRWTCRWRSRSPLAARPRRQEPHDRRRRGRAARRAARRAQARAAAARGLQAGFARATCRPGGAGGARPTGGRSSRGDPPRGPGGGTRGRLPSVPRDDRRGARDRPSRHGGRHAPMLVWRPSAGATSIVGPQPDLLRPSDRATTRTT